MSEAKNDEQKKRYKHVNSKYPVGRRSAVKPAEAAAITGLHLAGMSGTEIATRIGRSKQTISAILNSEETKHARELAKSILVSNASEFANNWITAARRAAAKGKHEPSKEALEAIGAVENKPKPDRGGFVVKIGVCLPGLGLPAGSVESPIATALVESAIDAESSEDANG
jgi:hypothetical protein